MELRGELLDSKLPYALMVGMAALGLSNDVDSSSAAHERIRPTMYTEAEIVNNSLNLIATAGRAIKYQIDWENRHPKQYANMIVTRSMIKEGENIEKCEEGKRGWHVEGPIYSGGEGIKNTSWVQAGGLMFAHNAGAATRNEQLVVTKWILHGQPWPDQAGCQPDGW